MKIDETDIRTYSAKQLTVDYTLPSTAVSVDMFDGALIPSEGETHTPLSGVTRWAFCLEAGRETRCRGMSVISMQCCKKALRSLWTDIQGGSKGI